MHIMHDITDNKRMEAELIKTQKLESIGILAGGIAHDFNNLLTGIMGNISLTLLSEEITPAAWKRMTEAEHACVRAKDLTQRLLTFSTGGTPVKRIAQLGEVLKETVSLSLAGSSVKAEFLLPEEEYLIEIDEGQMRQVIQNITMNAVDAMPQGGTIFVSCEQVSGETDRNVPAGAELFLRMTIRDEGHGIPSKDLMNIFDPFFTLKKNRSGLGLSTSYSIVKSHGGSIVAESQPGQGAAFHIYLPAHRHQETSPDGGIAKTSQGRVLIMDDEKMIRDVASEILKRAGYETGVAEDGLEAVTLYWDAKKRASPFHAVILDLTIPGGMGGMETLAKLRQIDPSIRAIVSSGYAKDPIIANYREHGFSGVVAKPYNMKELIQSVRTIVNPVLQ